MWVCICARVCSILLLAVCYLLGVFSIILANFLLFVSFALLASPFVVFTVGLAGTAWTLEGGKLHLSAREIKSATANLLPLMLKQG